ncbi:MAG TPA: homoserine dehydrogenase [Longimicrobiales bacterium]
MNVGVALYGLGNVGSGLVEILHARGQELCATRGVALELRHVVIRDPARPRRVRPRRVELSRDWRAPLDDAQVDVVVEAMGGLDTAGAVVETALRAGKHVVTANKALVAARGEELEALAREGCAELRYEAAVGGAIPVLHALRNALVANRITRVRGILNGTTNYILTRMAEDRLPLADALAKAQQLGFAEADPSADVSGLDAAQKLVILARHAFGRWIPLDAARIDGIERLTPGDVDDARRRGNVVKLVAEAACGDGGSVTLRVGPVEVPGSDPLAQVRDEVNAVTLEGDFAGPLTFIGRGAGSRPTGSAVFADLVELALLHRSRWERN